MFMGLFIQQAGRVPDFFLIHLKFYKVPKQNVKRLKMNKYSRKCLCKPRRSYLNGINPKQLHILHESYRAEKHLSNAMFFFFPGIFFSATVHNDEMDSRQA